MFNRFDTETRIAVMQAIDEARTLGHDQVGTDHLLLGLLANVRGDAARALMQAGLDFPTAEAAVIAYHEANPSPAPEAESASDDEELDDDLAADREALAAVGIDLDSVRNAVRRRFGTDIADGWGGGRRGDGFGPRGRGRGRRGPRSERLGPMRRFSPELREVVTTLMHEARMDFAQSRLDDAQERLNEEREAGPRDFSEEGPRGPRGERGPRGRGHHGHHRFAPGGPREGMRPGPGEWGFGPGEFGGRGPGEFGGRGPGRGGRRGFGGPQLSADKVLVALLQSDDPALSAVLAQIDRDAVITAVTANA
ncbi:Clp protease N-terminal domain-containing protein [Branchiibius sp. NY16-3462-2]|uniref:Clp protease N-terminal domain-containing protein n=1 Tax=Branchiibius sp. NY16-3462-2 TaxID=1807500 RepID=UPI000791F549|nr:Clp protease N-terminal domain-containing protein [Branchiibius sp. NY16-3462-2]KYH44963.1 hypothetical protein AZH51_13770 [Branchiibius sp. NY16-3462-2]